MSKVFEHPSKKLFIVDLCHSTDLKVKNEPKTSSEAERNDSSTSRCWMTDCAGIPVTFSICNIQGLVVHTLANGDQLFIDDGTAVAKVKGINRIPYLTSKPQKGQYIMVAGQLQTAGPRPCIKPVKIQNLSDDVELATMWPLEVIDAIAQN